MNTQEHLERIKEKCHELLAIAEKRTQGTWFTGWLGGKSGPTCPTMSGPFCAGDKYPFGIVGYGCETVAITPDQDKGQRNGNAKLNSDTVLKIREAISTSGLEQKEIAKLFNVTDQTVSKIKRRKLWNHI